jgi:hypothetical protein
MILINLSGRAVIPEATNVYSRAVKLWRNLMTHVLYGFKLTPARHLHKYIKYTEHGQTV